jgi:Flp pilus assembly pilin Flp
VTNAQAQPAHPHEQADEGGSNSGESTLTVIVALVANALIAVMKAVAGC